ncbi:MAG: LPS assembly protein LptD, partial [Pseudomonadota bacterium]
MTARFFLFACLLVVPSFLVAQDAATLIADRVSVGEDRVLRAEGNVEIFQGTTRVRASRISYDGAGGTLLIEGPIELRDGESTVILADQAALSEGLQNGILKGARLVLDQQLQLVAVEMQRIEGRFTQGYRVAATSCHVCESGRPPLWQIRAKRVIHDVEERQLYFDEAQLRVMGVPVLYTPHLRLPDPTLERASGVLFPVFETSSLLGWGVKIPYFFVLGDHADLTVTPFLTTKTRTVELRYRQAFQAGDIDFDVFVSDDEITGDDIEIGILGEGVFDVARGYTLRFDVEQESDRGYLSDYDYSDKDRLDTALSLARTRAGDDTFIELVGIRSLRDGEGTDTFPALLFDARHAARLGAYGLATFDFQAHYRGSTSTADADADGVSDGLDRARLGLEIDWRRSFLLRHGFVFETKAQAAADLFLLTKDPAFDESLTRGRGAAAIGLRWPLARLSETGALNVLEPHIQLAFSDASAATLPNEASTRVEFDEGNLFDLNRFPGQDRVEMGLRADIGLTWRRKGPMGWDSALTLGRVERFSGDNDFTASSGLSGDNSDWLISGSLVTGDGVDISGRVL